MMQLTLLSRPGTSLQLPTKVLEVTINPVIHNTRLWERKKDETGRFIVHNMTNGIKFAFNSCNVRI